MATRERGIEITRVALSPSSEPSKGLLDMVEDTSVTRVIVGGRTVQPIRNVVMRCEVPAMMTPDGGMVHRNDEFTVSAVEAAFFVQARSASRVAVTPGAEEEPSVETGEEAGTDDREAASDPDAVVEPEPATSPVDPAPPATSERSAVAQPRQPSTPMKSHQPPPKPKRR